MIQPLSASLELKLSIQLHRSSVVVRPVRRPNNLPTRATTDCVPSLNCQLPTTKFNRVAKSRGPLALGTGDTSLHQPASGCGSPKEYAYSRMVLARSFSIITKSPPTSEDPRQICSLFIHPTTIEIPESPICAHAARRRPSFWQCIPKCLVRTTVHAWARSEARYPCQPGLRVGASGRWRFSDPVGLWTCRQLGGIGVQDRSGQR
ncbi:hypothetical protein B0H10DRAFT_1030645 [Mycena sp. CBHHK59/15]|nr:hypothetical protein B0H10DRAFT_1030645 [Mycena sp. CBHHK59/15]